MLAIGGKVILPVSGLAGAYILPILSCGILPKDKIFSGNRPGDVNIFTILLKENR
jgi:hypothetical protein